MRQVNCYHCGSDQNAFYASENGFNLVKCSQCGLLYVNPRPDDNEIEHASRMGIHQGQKKLRVTGIFSRHKVCTYLKVLNDFFGTGHDLSEKTWLDIGCGHGEFLQAVQKFSSGTLKVKGLEPNISKQKSARKRGLDVSFFDLDNHSQKYDVISCLNVFSHLPDPPKAILSWKHLLKSGGELILETGDVANLDSKDQIRPMYLPDHLSFAGERIIIDILEKCGFKIVDIKKYPYIKGKIYFILKETVKLFMPRKKSLLNAWLKLKKHAQSDMYIRARLIG